jgi:hypothetical protein
MCLACGCDTRLRERMAVAVSDPAYPTPDERVLTTIEDTLDLAGSWLGWNGIATIWGDSAWTPQKSLRRITDHFIDHLAQIECRIAGVEALSDTWHGRRVTLDSDWAHFTELDLDEASARLRRLGQVISLRLVAHPELWDEGGPEWSLRGIAGHLVEAMEVYRAKPVASLIAPK